MRDTHALRRTSPKGGPFVGTCFKCGAENLPASAVGKPCTNPGGLNQDQSLLAAIDGFDEPEGDAHDDA